MKHLLIISLAALTLSACQAASSDPSPSSQAKAPEAMHAQAMAIPIKAVRIYADWCPKCKVLDAQLKTLRASNDYPNVEFIYLDFTQKDADIFYAQAREHGVEAQVKEAFGTGRIRTGQMFLFHDKTDELLSTITHTMTDEDLTTALMVKAS